MMRVADTTAIWILRNWHVSQVNLSYVHNDTFANFFQQYMTIVKDSYVGNEMIYGVLCTPTYFSRHEWRDVQERRPYGVCAIIFSNFVPHVKPTMDGMWDLVVSVRVHPSLINRIWWAYGYH